MSPEVFEFEPRKFDPEDSEGTQIYGFLSQYKEIELLADHFFNSFPLSAVFQPEMRETIATEFDQITAGYGEETRSAFRVGINANRDARRRANPGPLFDAFECLSTIYARHCFDATRQNQELIERDQIINGIKQASPVREIFFQVLNFFSSEIEGEEVDYEGAVEHFWLIEKLLPDFRAALVQNPLMCQELKTWLGSIKSLDQLTGRHTKSLMYILAYDFNESKKTQKTGIIESIYGKNSNQNGLIAEEVEETLISIFKEKEPSEGYVGQFFKFMCVLGKIDIDDTESLSKLVVEYAEHLPIEVKSFIETQHDKKVTLNKTRISSLLNEVSKKYLLDFINNDFDDLNNLYNKALRFVDPQYLDSQSREPSPKTKRPKTRQKRKQLQNDNNDRKMNPEKEPVNRTFVKLAPNLKVNNGNSHTVEDAKISPDGPVDVVEKMLDDLLKTHDKNIKGKVLEALNELKYKRIPLGVKTFGNISFIIDGKKESLKSFKPCDVPGLSGSPIFNRVRIEFVYLLDDRIGLHGMHIRDDKPYTKR